jgi:predicted outer membrane protein
MQKRIGFGILMVAAITASCSAIVRAQQNETTRGERREDSQPGRPGPLDEHVAQCLLFSNQNEVAAAQIAEKKAQNSEVKEFAAMMVKDHGQFISSLEKFAGQNYQRRNDRSGSKTTETAPPAENRQANRQTTPDSKRQGDRNDPTAKFTTIRQEIAAQCLASTKRELDSKQGNAFDECYIGMQIGEHMKMVDELTVLAKHVSADLKPVLETGLKTAQHHLEEAKRIAKEVKGSAKTAAKEKDEDSN